MEDVVIKIEIMEQEEPEPAKEEITTQGGTTLLQFMDEIIKEKNDDGHFRTAENYGATQRRLREFFTANDKTKDPTLESLREETIIDFEKFLIDRKMTKNTLSFYLRILRATCNRARNEGHNIPEKIFQSVYTGKEKTKKRALSAASIRKVVLAETKNDNESFARDLFIFSFITRGMSTIDIAKLTSDNIIGKRLSYKRSKTGQELTMEWLSEMKNIVTRWRKPPIQGIPTYLFPIISHNGDEGHKDYRKVQRRINYSLKNLGKRLGLPIPLTMYVARHSWASLAREGGVPVTVIGDALGHTSESTTRIYLDNLSANKIDEANRKVMKLTLGKKSKKKMSAALA